METSISQSNEGNLIIYKTCLSADSWRDDNISEGASEGPRSEWSCNSGVLEVPGGDRGGV